jgi:hypothetical protein
MGRFGGFSAISGFPDVGSVVSTPTCISLSSGKYFETGASSSSLPSSTNTIAATLVTGLVMDAIQKIESGFIGVVLARS